tara:strand:- start:18109 stop:18495 length:387 start_codon:yes stop_codon:yes gene_type:complete
MESLLPMLGGAVSGFIFKLIGTMVQAQQTQVELMLKKQEAADASADKAASRGGVWVRRGIVATVLFAIVIVPFIMAFSDQGVTVEVSKGWWIFARDVYETQEGFLLHPSVVQALYAIIGFYFGSSQIK